MNERISYILTSLDMHLSGGMEPLAAIVATVEDYRDVYLVDDDRPVIARAADVALKRMGGWNAAEKNVPPTHEAVEWICTQCEWAGYYNNTVSAMYHGIDWQQCPVCKSVAIPLAGSTKCGGR